MARSRDYRLGTYDFPRGWFMVAESEGVNRTPVAARFFGQELVLYRGESGRLVMLDAYCPHMGTHLGRNSTSYVIRDGAVEGESIRCPYHAWRFGPDGRCNEIPYYDGRIPAAARVRSWRIEEAMGAVFAWHDPEGGEPEYDLPRLAEWDDPAWVRWVFDRLGPMDCHPQEIVDNMADVAHFPPVHGSSPDYAYFENEIRGHILRMRYGAGHRTLASGDAILDSDVWYTGPGILMSRQKGIHSSIQMITHTPVDDGVIRIWHALLVRGRGATADDTDAAAARVNQAANLVAFTQDFDIWSNKRPALSILQIAADGPFPAVRAWYRQFYNPRGSTSAATFDGVHAVRARSRSTGAP
jgi:3-ketosteroid 9alpha-monooxygenase subunit A